MKRSRVTTKKNLSPWRNSDGSKKTDAEISLLGKKWYLETWKDFLDEDVGRVKNRYCRKASSSRSKRGHLRLIRGGKY